MLAVTHSTFSIERSYRAPIAKVFRAFADPAAKQEWFIGGDGWKQLSREDDFRVGGGERLVGRSSDGTITDFRSRYEEIVPNERIIFTYHMLHNETELSISLATVEFAPEGNGTKLKFTEQLACINGYEDPDGRDRMHGTSLHLERLASYLERAAAPA